MVSPGTPAECACSAPRDPLQRLHVPGRRRGSLWRLGRNRVARNRAVPDNGRPSDSHVDTGSKLDLVLRSAVRQKRFQSNAAFDQPQADKESIMATKNTTKDIETVEQVEALEFLEIVDAGIKQVVADHEIDIQKARYKAMRAIAWQAFIEHIEAGTFEDLVDRASANVDNLPSGWELTAEAAKAKKATPVKTRTKKATA